MFGKFASNEFQCLVMVPHLTNNSLSYMLEFDFISNVYRNNSLFSFFNNS